MFDDQKLWCDAMFCAWIRQDVVMVGEEKEVEEGRRNSEKHCGAYLVDGSGRYASRWEFT